MGNLKRRLPGHSSLSSGVTDRSDSSPGPNVSDDLTSQLDHAILCTTSNSGQPQSHRSQREAFSTAFTAGAASDPPGSAEQSDRFPSRCGTSRADSLPQHGGWTLWRSIKQSFSDVPTKSSRAGIKSKGFEPFGILSKAASGIASTTTTMATTLDEAMENFFEGWTPAPPAADHTSFHSPYHRYQSHGSTAASQSTGKMALSARPEEAAALPSNQKHEVNDDWEEWESPFHSKSASPNVENQDPNDNEQAGNGISAWHGCSPDHGHSEAQPVAMRGTTGGQKHRSSIEDTSLHALPRVGEYTYLQAANVQASGHDCGQESSQQLQLAAKTAEKAKQRVVQLQGKLQACDASPGSFSRLRQEVASALDEVALASQRCALLSQQHQATPSNPELVVDQVSAQLQALLAEKARLAQENARLARENTGLQELLQYTMDQHLREAEPVQAEASEDLEEWAALATSSPQGAASLSPQKGSPVQTDPNTGSEPILNAAD
ncbi:hypothetical protein ABBQ32_002417 [Trebouxia sp. C0010 RCD-2024]